MIVISSNILYCCIGIVLSRLVLPLQVIGFGQTGVVGSLRVEFHGFSLLAILRSLVDVTIHGRSLGRDMERAPMMGQGLF
jgi:hypothetical protein